MKPIGTFFLDVESRFSPKTESLVSLTGNNKVD